MIQGEPQVADSSAFYSQLVERLAREQAIGTEALARLGEQRAGAIVAALKDAGVDASRAVATAPDKGPPVTGKSVPL